MCVDFITDKVAKKSGGVRVVVRFLTLIDANFGFNSTVLFTCV